VGCQFALGDEFNEEFEAFFVRRGNDGVGAFDSFSVVIHAKGGVLAGFEAERAAGVNANQPQVFAQILSLENFCDVVFVAREIRLRFGHYSSFEAEISITIRTKKKGRNCRQVRPKILLYFPTARQPVRSVATDSVSVACAAA